MVAPRWPGRGAVSSRLFCSWDVRCEPACFHPSLSRVRFRFSMLTTKGPVGAPLCEVVRGWLDAGENLGLLTNAITGSRGRRKRVVGMAAMRHSCQRRRSYPRQDCLSRMRCVTRAGRAGLPCLRRYQIAQYQSHLISKDLLYHAMLWPTALQEQEMMPLRDSKHDIEPLAISSPYENAKAKC